MRVRKVTDRDYLESKLALFLTNAHTRAEPPVGSLNGLNPEAYGTQSQPPDKLIAHEHDTSQRLVPEQDPTVHVALPHVLVQPEQSANAVCAMAIPITMVAVPNQLHKILATGVVFRSVETSESFLRPMHVRAARFRSWVHRLTRPLAATGPAPAGYIMRNRNHHPHSTCTHRTFRICSFRYNYLCYKLHRRTFSCIRNTLLQMHPATWQFRERSLLRRATHTGC
jgi:hypothetical protein